MTLRAFLHRRLPEKAEFQIPLARHMSALKDIDILATAMESIGFRLVQSEAGTMDSGSAEFSDGERKLRISKDRSQWMFCGSQRELEPWGLWRAFDDTLEFRDAIVDYIKRRDA
jgi:hypothetical protein